MELFLQQVVSGLATGAIYASLALALVMIFQSTNHINFAQGEMALLSTYLAWSLIGAGLPWLAAFVITIAASFAFGVAVERVVIRSFHDAPVFALIVVFMGLFLAFNSMASWIWGFEIKSFTSPVRSLSTGTPMISAHDLFIMAVTLLLLGLVFAFFRFTKLGLAMRAAAFNPVSAELVGIRVGWVLALGWGMAGALGAVSGMLVAPIVFLDPNMMLGILLYAFASAMLGGLNNPFGAVMGGLIFGVMENIVGTYIIGHELKLTFALVVVIGVLLVKPSGLFGKTITRRV
ncbi:MAG: branched-chain amino acid ABC transporter permease [Sagittula sp.]|uniref:branched-chain amino acid ABC transporter permease n=1 Tax=Sagittula sp. TaxID=2038081 RepID=UPI004058D02B